MKGPKHREDTVAANVRFLNPKTMAKPPGYTYVVEATGPNRLIFIAGQLGLDLDNKLVGLSGDFRAQCAKAFENLGYALASMGATFNDVVKINNYLVDMSHIPIFREVRDAFLNMKAPPASTTVAISQLARPGALFRSRRSPYCRRGGGQTGGQAEQGEVAREKVEIKRKTLASSAHARVTMPDIPGVGFEAKNDLYKVMKQLVN
jgi:enamine deaminase RidA (YjgF/YER057c/UK114 family)